MSSTVSQKEYIKKYLNPGDHERKKKRKKIGSGRGTKVVDDDVDLSKMSHDDGYEESGEYAPQIVGVTDDRPEDVRMKEDFNTDRWKSLKGNEGKSEGGRRRHDSDGDPGGYHDRRPSPPHRGGRQRHDSDQSPPRGRQRHDSDQSPPRERQRHDSDQSPPRGRQRHDSDQSPPRGRPHHGADPSYRGPPPRGQHDRDLSPPRRRMKHDDRGHVPSPAKSRSQQQRDSPQVRQRHDSDLSPKRPRRPSPERGLKRDRSPKSGEAGGEPRKPRRNRWDSPPPADKGRSMEGSPERRKEGGDYSPRRAEGKGVQNGGRPSSTLEGKKAGLQHAQALREENKMRKQKEKEFFDSVDSSVSGKGAKTVMRQGKQREMEEKRRRKEEEEKKQAELNEKYKYWSKGVKQSADKRARIEQELHEMQKPLARYAGDDDLEQHLKDKDREGDPMLAMVQKKRSKNASQKKQKAIYQGSYPPNRFNIRPGYRWDGVDRSNGYEKEVLSRKSNKKAMEDEQYKWSVEDM